MNAAPDPHLRREPWNLTAAPMRALEIPMLVLSGRRSLLLVIEFTRGLAIWCFRLDSTIASRLPQQSFVYFSASLDN